MRGDRYRFSELVLGIVKSAPFQMRMKEAAPLQTTAKRPIKKRGIMFITKKHLPRRTFLRGMGVTLALPLLDSMVPAQTPLAKTAAVSKTRFCGIYVPHGATMDKWTPAQEGSAFEFSESLKPLEKLRDRLCVVTQSGASQRLAASARMLERITPDPPRYS